jgi:sulfite reductase alpha subunit-like flavoprotein
LTSRGSSEQPPRSALILYGSETGNAQDVAEEVYRLTERLHFRSTLLDLDAVPLRDLLRPTLVIFVVSTTGQGDVPQNARAFWKRVLSSALKPGILRRLQFSTFGLGDSSYPQYNIAHRALHARLVQLGAKSFCERGEGNEQHPEGHSAGVREWLFLLRDKLLEQFPLPNGVEPVPADVFVEPQWRLALDESSRGSSSLEDGLVTSATPSTALIPIHGAHPVLIEDNARITTPNYFQDVRHIVLRTDEPLEYGPGAVAVIYPKNYPEDVNHFIELMGWKDIADRPLHLVASSDYRPRQGSASPLRALDLSKTPLTIRWLLENVLDIMSIPRRSFFASLVYFAGTRTEDESYQKTRLLELADPALIDELWDYTTRPKRTILEVMMDFTTLKIPWQYALTTLPLLRGRQFSIASGGALKRDPATGQTRIELLVAIVNTPSPIIKYRPRYGVATRYMAAWQPGTSISMGLHPGYLATHPDDLATPALMIGPGTGVAPLRALIHERLAWSSSDNFQGPTPTAADTAAATTTLAQDMLIFGCRSSTADYFFREEWTHLAATCGLRHFTAFSRETGPSAAKREYVQDVIRRQADAVWELLVNRHGKVYVCGSSGNMPKGVRQAIVEVLTGATGDGSAGFSSSSANGKADDGESVRVAKAGKRGEEIIAQGVATVALGRRTMSVDEAETFLVEMEKKGRYWQETW